MYIVFIDILDYFFAIALKLFYVDNEKFIEFEVDRESSKSSIFTKAIRICPAHFFFIKKSKYKQDAKCIHNAATHKIGKIFPECAFFILLRYYTFAF